MWSFKLLIMSEIFAFYFEVFHSFMNFSNKNVFCTLEMLGKKCCDGPNSKQNVLITDLDDIDFTYEDAPDGFHRQTQQVKIKNQIQQRRKTT